LKASTLKKLPRKRQTQAELLELQRLMAGAVMLPLAPDGGMSAKSRNGRPMKAVAADFIKPNDRLTSFERLEIYNRQYWFRLRDCFYDDYPGLRTVLGNRCFEKLAKAYLERNPSRSFTLRNLGSRLIEFLEREPKWVAPHNQLALDMARLEWAHIEAFDNESKPTLEVGSLIGRDPTKLRLKLQPHVSLLHLHYELDKFLIQIKRAEGLRGEASNAFEERHARLRSHLKRRLRPVDLFLAVHRYQNTVYYKRLKPAQFHLLSAFKNNATLAEAFDAAAASGGDLNELGAQVKSWFQNWASLGWFCRL
jgi:Putative DNA-binding domain